MNPANLSGANVNWSLTNRKSATWLAPIIVGLLAMVVSYCLSVINPPLPKVHDEFSYLLAADTFASGRTTNPTHPFADHFESIHVIQRPSYASKYQPGPGLIMGAGQRLTGQPIAGVWFSTGLAAAALCWMLAGWVPRRWATTGGLLAVMHIGLQTDWGHSFWGGSMPFLGGTLVLGAMARWMKAPRVAWGVVAGCGAAVLAATRPFEGAMLCGVAGMFMLINHFRAGHSIRQLLVTLCAPVGMIAGLCLIGLGWYNLEVTGSPLTMPYQVHEKTYAASPLFLWGTPQEPEPHRHAALRDYYLGWGMEHYERQQSIGGWLSDHTQGMLSVWNFYFGIALSIPFLAIQYLVKRRRLRMVWAMLLACFAATLVVPWTMPHYIAPFAPLLFVLLIDGCRYLQTLRRDPMRFGRFVVPGVLFLNAALFGTAVFTLSDNTDDWHVVRAKIEARIADDERSALVFVEYGSNHNPHCEWVYNRADIDNAPVVWARSMGAEADAKLCRYFADRETWHLRLDGRDQSFTKLASSPQSDVTSRVR